MDTDGAAVGVEEVAMVDMEDSDNVANKRDPSFQNEYSKMQ